MHRALGGGGRFCRFARRLLLVAGVRATPAPAARPDQPGAGGRAAAMWGDGEGSAYKPSCHYRKSLDTRPRPAAARNRWVRDFGGLSTEPTRQTENSNCPARRPAGGSVGSACGIDAPVFFQRSNPLLEIRMELVNRRLFSAWAASLVQRLSGRYGVAVGLLCEVGAASYSSSPSAGADPGPSIKRTPRA